MSKGFVMVSKDKLESWCWRGNPNKSYVFWSLLFKANYKPEGFGKITVGRGQVVFTYDKLSVELGVSLQTLRTTLRDLIETGDINIQSTRNWSLLTICEYDSWLNNDTQCNTQINTLTNTNIINKEYNNNIYSDEIENLRLENEELKKKLDDALAGVKNKNKRVSKTLGGRARDVFENYYNELGVSDAPYYWTAKDAGQMKNVLNALRFSREQKGMTTTDDDLIYSLGYLLNSIHDKWILEHLSVSTVYSKFNDIVAGAKAKRTSVDNETKIINLQKYEPAGLAYRSELDAYNIQNQFPEYANDWPYDNENRPEGARLCYQMDVWSWSAADKKWIRTT